MNEQQAEIIQKQAARVRVLEAENLQLKRRLDRASRLLGEQAINMPHSVSAPSYETPTATRVGDLNNTAEKCGAGK